MSPLITGVPTPNELRAVRSHGLVRVCLDAETAYGLPRALLLAIVVGDPERGDVDGEAAASLAEILAATLSVGRARGLAGDDLAAFAATACRSGWRSAVDTLSAGRPAPAESGYGAEVAERMKLFRSLIDRDSRIRAVRRCQAPELPIQVEFPEGAYPRPRTAHGLQPWIVPQVDAICERFELQVAAGWGGDTPCSDHAWGGACDLVGSEPAMAACADWAERHLADPYRPGAVFRSVRGPAANGNGNGHARGRVHLAWYRLGPATTVFETPEFAVS